MSKHYTMNAYGGSEVKIHALETPELDGGDWIVLLSSKGTFGVQWKGGNSDR
jgi:hypothetical protein